MCSMNVKRALLILFLLGFVVPYVFLEFHNPVEMLAIIVVGYVIIYCLVGAVPRISEHFKKYNSWSVRMLSLLINFLLFTMAIYVLIVVEVAWFEKRLIINVIGVERGINYIIATLLLAVFMLGFFLYTRVAGKKELFDSIFIK